MKLTTRTQFSIDEIPNKHWVKNLQIEFSSKESFNKFAEKLGRRMASTLKRIVIQKLYK